MQTPNEQFISIEQLQKALTYDGADRPALVARIPVICNDVREIKDALITMNNTMWWQSRIAAVAGTVILTLLAAFISAGKF